MNEGPEDRPNAGTSGASARREHARRQAAREQRVREKHPRIGGLLLALSNEPQHERAWRDGAAGEEKTATYLDRFLDKEVTILHDRRIPGRRANIDHIAIASSGVWVIDTKRYTGKVEVRAPLFGGATLTIARRDKSELVDRLARQVEVVRAVVDETAPDIPISGALCFIKAELPMFTTLTFKGVYLLYPKALAKRINKTGPVSPDDVRRIALRVATHFPPA